MLAQKKLGPSSKTINEATRLFSGLADLDFEPGYGDYVYFQHLLALDELAKVKTFKGTRCFKSEYRILV